MSHHLMFDIDQIEQNSEQPAAVKPIWGGPPEVDCVRAWRCRWHGPAAAAGWTALQLFDLGADAPQVRRDLMGVAWLANLNGHQTVAVDREAIRLVTRTAARLSVYRPGAGGVLAWKLCAETIRDRERAS
jgi:hypothetical protein